MTIDLSEYNIEWLTLFDTEKSIISLNFPIQEILIEHIGSTSVKDLKAKPIIDIMIGLTELPSDISPVVKYLRTLGYEYISEYNLTIPERRFFQKDINGKRSHHIHMVSFNSDFWDRHLFFRNQLRSNPLIREEYGKLKIELTTQQWNSVNDYANAKSNFIKSIDALRVKLSTKHFKNNNQTVLIIIKTKSPEITLRALWLSKTKNHGVFLVMLTWYEYHAIIFKGWRYQQVQPPTFCFLEELFFSVHFIF